MARLSRLVGLSVSSESRPCVRTEGYLGFLEFRLAGFDAESELELRKCDGLLASACLKVSSSYSSGSGLEYCFGLNACRELESLDGPFGRLDEVASPKSGKVAEVTGESTTSANSPPSM